VSGVPKLVELHVDGEVLLVPAGRSIAAALIHAGRPALRRGPGGAPRGVYCGIGVCFECRVHVEGRGLVRACMTPVQAGMRVSLAGH
jgi:predicted molibdopterin-dependent oxidoreductase YjgC